MPIESADAQSSRGMVPHDDVQPLPGARPNAGRGGSFRHYAFIVPVCLVVFFSRLGGARLWDRDEPRNARCAVEMLDRGDWIVPTFNGQLRAHKPVLLYWLMMSAYQVFGVSEFSARFWSAVLASGTVLATYHAGRCLFGASAGLWSAAVLASTLMFVVIGRAATPDSALVFLTTLAMTVLLAQLSRRSADDTSWSASRRMWWMFYSAAAVAVLAKGPVGFILPAASVGVFLVWQHRAFTPAQMARTLWAMRPLTGLVALCALAVPWYVLVQRATDGQWLYEFFWQHHVGRAIRTMEGHSGSIVFYPLSIWAGFFPWSVLAVPVALHVFHSLRKTERRAGDTGRSQRQQERQERERRGQETCAQRSAVRGFPAPAQPPTEGLPALPNGLPVASPALGTPARSGDVRRARRETGTQQVERSHYVALLCWIGVWVTAFSLARTKLPNYVVPAYPALAILTGTFLDRWLRGECRVRPLWIMLGWPTLGVCGLGLSIAIALAAHDHLPGYEWMGATGLIAVAGAAIAGTCQWRRQHRWAAVTLSLTAVTLTTFMASVLAPQISARQNYEALWARLPGHRSPQVAAGRHVRLAAFLCLEPSWVFYAGQTIPLYTAQQLEQAVAFLLASPDHYLLTNDQGLQLLETRLATTLHVAAQTDYFLKNDRLVTIPGFAHQQRPGSANPDGHQPAQQARPRAKPKRIRLAETPGSDPPY